jgi:hypothetical protein
VSGKTERRNMSNRHDVRMSGLQLADIERDFGEQQFVVCRIDNAAKRRFASLAFKAITFKSALVHMRRATSEKFEFQAAMGANNHLR